MQITGHHNYASENKAFNERVALLVGKIFQTEHCEPIGYVAPRRYAPRAAQTTTPDRSRDVVERSVAEDDALRRYAITDLGDYEKIIFGALASGNSSTYVLAGEMGSGKTATMTYMRKILSQKALAPCDNECKICDPEVVFVSLDSGTQYTSKEANPVAAFRNDLIHSLNGRVRALFVLEQLTDRFLLFCKTAREQRYQRFGDFQTAVSMWQLDHGQAFSSLDEELKCNFLLNWVQNAGSPELRLDLLSALASFIKTVARRNAACLTILIDNIDRHIEPSQQMDILLLLFGLQDTGIPVLVAMRQTTFAGLGSIAAFSFQYIPHVGPSPLTVGLERVRYYLAHEEDWDVGAPLHDLERNCLRDRLRAIETLLASSEFPRGRLKALCGSSVRAGLTILNRLVINNTTPFYSAEPVYKQDWLRAAILGDDPQQRFDPRDRYVVNLFAGSSHGRFSWICVRLLQLVEAFFATPPARMAKNLSALLKIMLDGPSAGDLVDAVNYLLQPTRPLLWVDGAYEYKSYDELLARNDVFNLTRTGHLYWKNLVVDALYLQESLYSAVWSAAAAPVVVNMHSAVTRSEGTRAIADVMLREDMLQHRRLLDAVERTEYLEPIRSLPPVSLIIASRLGISAAESMKNAVTSLANAFEVKKEADAWQQVLDLGQRETEAMGLRVPPIFERARHSLKVAVEMCDGLLRHA